MTDVPFEIERKFLIRKPDLLWLSSAADSSQIVQTYLDSAEEGTSERVRCRTTGAHSVYTHTTKTHLTARKRIELEEELDRETYERLLQRADPTRRIIEKTRYCLRSGSWLYEIDVFPFWERQAFLEIELHDENEAFPWPEGIALIREVTDDKRYTNSALALHIPAED